MASAKAIAVASAVRSTAKDATIGRFRPLVIVAESVAGPGYAKARSTFEARVRKAKGNSGSVAVQGWRAPDGKLWEANKQVWVVSTSTRLGGYYLIADVEFSVDGEGGKITRMKLKDPDAYFAALTFLAADAKDVDLLEAKKSARRTKKSGLLSLKKIL